MGGNRAGDFAGEAAGVAGRIQRHILDRPALCPQFLRKVAHGAEEESDLLLVVAHIGRLLADFDHQHAVVRLVRRYQGAK